jgi:hypothetical protein
MSFGRPGSKCEDNIKRHLKRTGLENVNIIDLADLGASSELLKTQNFWSFIVYRDFLRFQKYYFLQEILFPME